MKSITEEMLKTLIDSERLAGPHEQIQAHAITLLAHECLRLRRLIEEIHLHYNPGMPGFDIEAALKEQQARDRSTDGDI